MLSFFTMNAATILVGLALLTAIILIIRGIYRDKKAGKSSCGGNCPGCPSCTACHNQKR